MEKLSIEQIQNKAEELSKRESCKVHPICFTTDQDEQVIGYVREPKRQAKFAALDEMMKSTTGCGETLLMSSIIKEESDPRITSLKPEDDALFMSACMECLRFVKMYSDDLKKK